MLQPREADVPVLFFVFIVLPLVAYFLLGKWNEVANKKARVSVLAQRAVEEDSRVEEMACADVALPTPSLRSDIYGPVSRSDFQVCAACGAPARRRCSKCKSVRYCSEKCQIIHWRQGHMQMCQQWDGNGLGSSFGPYSAEAFKQMPSLSTFHSPIHDIQSNIFFENTSDASSVTVDSSYNLDTDPDFLNKSTLHKYKSAVYGNVDDFSNACHEKDNTSVGEGTSFSKISSNDTSLENKLLAGEFGSLNGDDWNHDDTLYPAKSSAHQLNKSASETRKRPKSSNSVRALENGVHLSSVMVTSSEGGHAFVKEPLEKSRSSGRNSGKGSAMYKKPPYTVGQAVPMPQNSQERVLKEYHSDGLGKLSSNKNAEKGISKVGHSDGSNGVLKIESSKMEVSKKPSKFLKCSLIGLINDNKRNKVLQVLFPYEDLVKFFLYEVRGISPRGLHNCGNSCYANAVLQCLTCTKPLMVYLLQRLHSKNCLSKDWCLMRELEQHASMLRESGGPLSPSTILSNMRNIGCRLGGGSQEDAHEFLRVLVMSMQSACLDGLGGEKDVEPRLQETTVIQQIFGGRLKSKVKCLRCHHESERYENIMDLTLEIHGWVECLQDALTQFTAPEDLDGENMYRCGRCSAYVQARKQLSVHEVPNILTIVLKRFQTGKYGKINKCVTFPDMLDMIPFVTGSADYPPLYLLYGVVVHVDTENASFSGHYISYVKDMQGRWLRIDDSEVRPVSLSQVMSEGAYMLFYTRSFPRPPRIYIENTLLHASASAKRNVSKSHKSPKHEQQKQTQSFFASEEPIIGIYDFTLDGGGHTKEQNPDVISRNVYHTDESFADSVSMDFSDATSSEWSLFTSSDESSFTTESTRDSFSVVDYGDNAGLDSISSSIFGPFYSTDHPPGNFASCTRFSPSRLQTRYFSESTGCVLDSCVSTLPYGNVHKGRTLGCGCAGST